MSVKKAEGRVGSLRSASKFFDGNGLGKNVEFKLFAPEAQNVSVAGSFNGWSPEAFRLRKGRDGHWKGQTNLKRGRYEFRFVVDGRWESDPTRENVPNEFGSTNSVLEVK